jgi:ankyrin repeat protein
MTSQPLPDHPNLEQLKKQAKSLLQKARANEPGELERFRVLPALSAKSLAELNNLGLALHDAQSVIAREYGFKSWNDLREFVQERSLSFAGAVDEFVRSATGGAPARALRLLALHPAIAHANLHTELVLGDAVAVESRLSKQPEAVKQTGGIQAWEPLLYVCHTYLHQSAPERAEGLVATARALLKRGANPNVEYHYQWHRELPRTALWAALCATNNLPLAEALLEEGANPTDGVATHIAAGSGNNIQALELLYRFGMNVNGIPGGVPPLRYVMAWTGNNLASAPGVRWLLEHGADVNLSWGELDDAPLHIAAQRWNLQMVEALVQRGADIHRRRKDGRTAFAVAELQGNREVAAWLLAHGAKDDLSALDRFVAACARGDRPTAEAMLRESPGLRGQLQTEHHLMTQVPAERGDAVVLETMLACGFDPNVEDGEGITALHRAAMGGRVQAVRVLLAHGASVNALDGFVHGTPLVWAAHGWSQRAAATAADSADVVGHADAADGAEADGASANTDAVTGRGVSQHSNADHIGVARQLIAAGSPQEWAAPENAPDPEATHEQLAELCRAARQG